MDKIPLYQIKYVSRITGIPAHLIRTWELRYQAVSPQRSDSNHRLYHAGDIERLNLIRAAVENGHRISHVANLSRTELGQLIASETSNGLKRPTEANPSGSIANVYLTRSMHHIADLDTGSLLVTLDEAAVNLTRMALILEVIIPLWVRIHDLVMTGRFKWINLNLTTMSLQTLLWNMLKATVVSESAPKIVIAAPSGERYETEALALALIAVECGWRSAYFGPNLSATDVAEAVKSNRARAVALSIHHSNENASLGTEITKIRRSLDSVIDIIICGDATPLDHLAETKGISVAKVKNFRQKLEGLTDASTNHLND
jgi:DNA-binding transcriptional MerR regulator